TPYFVDAQYNSVGEVFLKQFRCKFWWVMKLQLFVLRCPHIHFEAFDQGLYPYFFIQWTLDEIGKEDKKQCSHNEENIGGAEIDIHGGGKSPVDHRSYKTSGKHSSKDKSKNTTTTQSKLSALAVHGIHRNSSEDRSEC